MEFKEETRRQFLKQGMRVSKSIAIFLVAAAALLIWSQAITDLAGSVQSRFWIVAAFLGLVLFIIFFRQFEKAKARWYAKRSVKQKQIIYVVEKSIDLLFMFFAGVLCYLMWLQDEMMGILYLLGALFVMGQRYWKEAKDKFMNIPDEQ